MTTTTTQPARSTEGADLPPVHPAADVLPLLAGDDFDRLVADVEANGLIEPVWMFEDPALGRVLLDGRNRWRACAAAGVKVKTRTYTGADPIGFSVALNVARRHLTVGQLAAVAHKVLPLYEAEAAARKVELSGTRADPTEQVGADRHQPPPEPGLVIRAPRATDRAAKAIGGSARSLARYKRLTEDAPGLAEQVAAGGLALEGAERLVRNRVAEARRVAEAKAAAAREPERLRVDIRDGDFREVLADLHDIDAIITDPPYGFEHLDLLDDLAVWADKVLAPDGVMAVLIGQTHLPEVYRRLEGHRPYRWTCAYMTPGHAYTSHPRKVSSQWKPLLVYGGGPRFNDVVTSAGDDKEHHRWGQNLDAFTEIIRRLTSPGQTVVDPFLGGGTTLLAARALGRHGIGCDTDPEAVAAARERLS